jgi:hypothetical protein
MKKKKTVVKEKKEESEEIAVKPHCKMLVCENEETGEIEVTYGKGCPKGYIEKIAGKIAVKGIHFKQEKED